MSDNTQFRTEKIQKMLSVLQPWYRENGRSLPWREDPTPYHVWVSEIMLQQTRIETVIPYYRRFTEELPDIRALAECDPERLQKLWEGLGYYSRVRNLRTAAEQIMNGFGGRFPESYGEIRSLCGIGDYTAGAIASICFDLPCPAVDGNVLRVLARITADPRPVSGEKIKQEVRKELADAYLAADRGAGSCGVLTQAIMELGETVCLPNGVPDCARCPCRDFCACSPDGGESWQSYPVREEKKARRAEQLTVFLLRSSIPGDSSPDGCRTAIRRRPKQGLLGGMWEFPNLPCRLSRAEALSQAEKWGCAPLSCAGERSARHIFTHVEWEMRCFEIICGAEGGKADGTNDLIWVSSRQLDESVSLPTAFRKLLGQNKHN